MSLISVFFLNQWLPTIINAAGVELSATLASSALLPIGGVTGGYFFARHVDRSANPFGMMAFVSLLGDGSMILLGQARDSLLLVVAAVFMVGCLVLGVQTALNCIVVVHYPTFIRATGATPSAMRPAG